MHRPRYLQLVNFYPESLREVVGFILLPFIYGTHYGARVMTSFHKELPGHFLDVANILVI